ncbi:MAG: cell division protein CrgA [Acidimicrobiia bacterium]
MPRSRETSRYTPPSPKKAPPSPLWWAVTMFTLMVVGLLVVVANYLNALPGDFETRYLFLGLGLLTAGFVMTTRYR